MNVVLRYFGVVTETLSPISSDYFNDSAACSKGVTFAPVLSLF